MSIRGIVTRGVGAVVGRKVAEETGNSGALGGLAGFGLAMLARRSSMGLATVGAFIVGKKIWDAKKAKKVQPTLVLEGGGTGEDPIDHYNDGSDAAKATNARDPALAASA